MFGPFRILSRLSIIVIGFRSEAPRWGIQMIAQFFLLAMGMLWLSIPWIKFWSWVDSLPTRKRARCYAF